MSHYLNYLPWVIIKDEKTWCSVIYVNKDVDLYGIPHILLNNIYYKLKRNIILNIYCNLKNLCIFLFIEWQYFNFHHGRK